MTKEINFRKEILLYRFFGWASIVVGIFFLIVLMVSRSHFLSFCSISLFFLVILLRIAISIRAGQRLIRFWIGDLKASLSFIPRNAVERTELISWATKRLSRFAEDATIAIEARERAIVQLDNFKFFLPATVRVVYQKSLPLIKKDLDELERLAETSVANAKAKHAQYLKVWDFFTKEQPKGLGILFYLKDPEEFRKRFANASR